MASWNSLYKGNLKFSKWLYRSRLDQTKCTLLPSFEACLDDDLKGYTILALKFFKLCILNFSILSEIFSRLYVEWMVVKVIWCEERRTNKRATLWTPRKGDFPAEIIALMGRRLRSLLVWRSISTCLQKGLSKVRDPSVGLRLRYYSMM
jgi:hypothetical protein